MIDIRALRDLIEAGRPFVVINSDGEVIDQGESGVVGPAVLIAVPVTDAVKVVAGGLVHDSLDRETLWSIEGFQLGVDVLVALGDDVVTSQSLIDVVIAAGFQWVISPKTGVL